MTKSELYVFLTSPRAAHYSRGIIAAVVRGAHAAAVSSVPPFEGQRAAEEADVVAVRVRLEIAAL